MSDTKKKTNKSSDIFFYATSSRKFLRKCVKPSFKEYVRLFYVHLIGLGFLGAIGYGVRLIHIPINNIIVNTGKIRLIKGGVIIVRRGKGVISILSCNSR
ncbi:Sec61-like protein transport protein [Hamiltosporidium tvaerminnensis]|uniref:Sec61-like protein transport protein n=1 Tax=Hamiltosporidium tvaerminnensis TaxID=1176355 RepID=A0A4Q9LZA0_9MICR|nr:Sec61-like protein transport protein [Hamiltosporidium tvaerminnensis]